MGIQEDLLDQLKQAMKASDRRTANVLRMIRSRVMERRTAKGFTGEVDDALYVDVIASYRKSLLKAAEEYDGHGERGLQEAADLRWEAAVCQRFLPQPITGEALEAIVAETIAASGVDNPRMAGRVVGQVMKAHKGRVDAAEVQRVVRTQLGG